MKKLFLIASIAALGLASTAKAADFPSYTKAPYSAAPYYNWTGLYLGINGGGGVSTDPANIAAANANAAFLVNSGVVPPSLKTDAYGAFGGGQVGYNWQTGTWVFGVETDVQYADIKGSDSRLLTLAPFAPISLTTAASSKLDVFGTVRGRVGYAFDRLMVYGTGGLGWGHTVDSSSVSLAAPAPFAAAAVGSVDVYRLGWVAGGGLEYAMWGNWTVKAEYLHMDLGGSSYTTGATVVGLPFAFTNSQKHTYDTVRGGVNYRF